MSWLFSRALVEAYSQATSSDGEPSAPLSGNPTPPLYSLNAKTKVISRLSRYGMTCKPLTESHGEELLKSSRADFLARTLVQPEKAQALPESAAECGNTWLGLLGKYDPATHSLKTAQCSLLEDSTSCLQTLPRSGSMRNGMLYQRQTVVRNIGASESGLLLPTVCKNEGRGSSRKRYRNSPPFPWGKDVGSVEDLRKRSDLPESLLWRGRNGVANRVERTESIGNGQVPRVAATAFNLLADRLMRPVP
jgi:hypothetical protein